MITHFVCQSFAGRFCLLLILFGMLASSQPGRAGEVLPFDSGQICRYSVDNIPRSIAVRQGADIWFGFDLEKALVFKVWKAPANKPGVVVKSFKAESTGAALFEGKTSGGWEIEIDGENVSLNVRYLGCTQNKDAYELGWELSYPDGTIKLSERIANVQAKDAAPVSRELRVESSGRGVSLALPAAYREAWVLTGPDGKPVKFLAGSSWHQLSLR